MKVIHITGDDDFSALMFEQHFAGKTVKELLISGVLDSDYDEWSTEVLEFGEVDPKFRTFIRSLQDYDMAKAENWYFEDETLPSV